MTHRIAWRLGVLVLFVAGGIWSGPRMREVGANSAPSRSSPGIDPAPPTEMVKLVFVHASVGNMWLGKWYGQLGSIAEGGEPTHYAQTSLRDNNYFVSDYNAPHEHPDEWPAHDYCAWPELFGDPAWMDRIINYSTADGNYDRLVDPGGENTIIMIKPCFTQYPIGGAPDDPPAPAGSPCEGNGTVGGIKRAMLDLLDILAQYPDKFFVLVTAPPKPLGRMAQGENARAVASWMATELLVDYEVGNVMIFDLYNVLTSNQQGPGDPCQQDEDEQSDVGMMTGNHHRIWEGAVQHQVGYDQTYSAYCDGHQKKGGLRKATIEFIPLLNAHYEAWQRGADRSSPAPTSTPTSSPPSTLPSTPPPSSSPTPMPPPTAAALAESLPTATPPTEEPVLSPTPFPEIEGTGAPPFWVWVGAALVLGFSLFLLINRLQRR